MQIANTYWMLSPNIGDALTPYIVEKKGTHKCAYSYPNNEEHYIVTGSILNHANEFTTVFGAGIAWKHDVVKKCKRIISTRGHLSREKAEEGGNKVEMIGDPALLMRYFEPKSSFDITDKVEIGIVPHYVDFKRVAASEHHTVDVLRHYRNVIFNMLKCEVVLCSSLHALILADTYNIPNAWIQLSEDIIGDNTKFLDYFSSVGRKETEPIDCRSFDYSAAIEQAKKWQPITYDFEALKQANPFQ